MATYIVTYLEFTIHLTDKERVAELQAQYPAGIKIAPDTAATTYAAPLQNLGTTFSAPCTRSPFFITLVKGNYPTNVASFTRKSGGWFGLSFLFGTNKTFRWVGKFAYAAGSTAEIDGVPTEVVAIAQRKFIVGLDGYQDAPINNMTAGVRAQMRGSSRHTDMAGWSHRVNATVQVPADGGGVAQNDESWERFYFRLRTAPSISQRFWFAKCGVTSNSGVALHMTPDRRIAIYNVLGTSLENLQATTTDQYAIDQWYRADILFSPNAGNGVAKVFIARRAVLDITVGGSSGLASNGVHETSALGGGTDNDLEMDFCDWTCQAWPEEDSNGRYVGKDWLNGSKVLWVPVTGLGVGNNWLGSYHFLNQKQAEAIEGGAAMTSAVSGDALRAVIQVANAKNVPGSLGAVAYTVCINAQQTVAGSGTIGWKRDGVIDLAAINPAQTTTRAWARRLYNPTGITEPFALDGTNDLELHHVKALNANPASVFAAGVLVELIGIFGEEDIPVGSETTVPDGVAKRGIHCAPYPGTSWAQSNVPPIAPVIVHSGTYIGAGVPVELQFRAPVTWFWIRTTSGTHAGSNHWSSMLGAHAIGIEVPNPSIQMMIDPAYVATGVEDSQEQRAVVRITAPSLTTGAATYQWVAVMDPGARFSLNGAFHHENTAGSVMPNALANAAFLPEYAFFFKERMAGSSYARYIKGPGHAANAGSILNAAESATVATFAAGDITSRETIHGQDDQSTAFSAWRTNDGSGDANVAKVVKIGTYIGDGAASRTIMFAPATGLRPLFAVVTPHNALSFSRDPSNTTNTSTNLSTGSTSTATAITAGGIDSITVGSTLNANGVVYEYFVLMGSATAGNGGWSVDGEFSYLEPAPPVDGYAETGDGAIDPIDDTPVDPDPDPGTDDTSDCDAGEVCVSATTRIVNQALLEIGSTKILTDYCTQDTIEAQTARILYEPSVRAVLHAFPWPFATKYAALALAATQPTDNDWEFAYRQPIDCIFERRISIDREGAVNPTPPPFELSSDASGGLIFTNEPDAILEYTMRPACVAFTGDPLFREALKWHLAAAMAPPVTRMTDKAKFCREEYDKCINRANAIIRPGDPGLRDAPTWQTSDVAAGAMAANISVANLALLRIGANTIANLTGDQSREAVAVNLIFEHELRATLRDFPWKFAKRYNDALVTVGGTSTVPVNPDWQYSYRLPTDYVAVRRLPTTGTGRSFERNPKTFEVGTDATGPLLFTGELDPNLEYTARIANAVLRADDLFRDALAWRLSASLAPSLAQVDPERQEQIGRGPEHPPDPEQRISHKPNKAAMRERATRFAFTMYLRALEKARVADANESDPEPDGDAEWIEGRA